MEFKKYENFNKKDKFFKVLEDAFLGKVGNITGSSAITKLMNIKSSYYSSFEKSLRKEIEEVLEKYPEFEEELYDKLYTFFSRYFTETGSIFFVNTAIHNNVYDKIYTNEEDVVLFWKTRDLYYIKTEKFFQKMDFDYKRYLFKFELSDVEWKQVEKKDVIFVLDKIDGNTITFKVLPKEGNHQTTFRDIVKQLRTKGINLTEEELEEIFRIYNKQVNIDFFIHKRPKEFLTEQFNLWLYNYLSSDNTLPVERINQLNMLRKIALKIIDFVAKFEDEMLKIWRKPRFVLNSGYLISFDRIAKRSGWEIIENIQKHTNWEKQVKEWLELGLLEKEPEVIIEQDLHGKRLNEEYQFLPLDTKYFKDMEPEILSLFDDLDNELNGWLIKSENWQALNTLLPRFRGKIKAIYIDPPYNTGSDDFLYIDRFRRATWLTMLENRLFLARDFLTEDGALLVSIGDTLRSEFRTSSMAYLQLLLNQLFGEENYIANFVRKSGIAPRQDIKHIANSHDYILAYAKDITKLRVNRKISENARYKFQDEYVHKRGKFALNQLDRGSIRYSESLDYPITIQPGELIEIFDGKEFFKIPAPEAIEIYPGGNPEDKVWTFRWSKEKVRWGIENGFIVFRKFNKDKTTWKVYFKEYEFVDNEGKPKKRTNPYDTLIVEHPNERGSDELERLFGTRSFDYPKPSSLIEYLMEIFTDENSIVLDFFAGSGSTAHAILNLNKRTGGNRKFILVEVAEHFDTIIIPRLKKLSYSFSWENGKAKEADGNGLFAKYYCLEQFEDILERAEFSSVYIKYCDVFDTDKKLLTYAEVDTTKDCIDYGIKKLYQSVDMYETLLCLGISVSPNIQLNEVPLNYVKNLLWW